MKGKKTISSILALCLLMTFMIIPITPNTHAVTMVPGIMVADSANRTDYDTDTSASDYWNKYYDSGGQSQFWLWKTLPDNPAIFRFELPGSATDFEPYFEGENEVQGFTIYASKDKSSWVEVAKMESTYDKNEVYNSTTGVITDDGYSKATEGRGFDEYYLANAESVLEDNEDKIVYLKIDDLTKNEALEIRVFGLTYTYDLDADPPEELNHGIYVADSANRDDENPDTSKSDYWNNYYHSGGQSQFWLWKTLPDDPAIFRFNLPDTTVRFEPYFEGEDDAQAFTIYASKNQIDWLPVAGMDDAYEKNRVYNASVGLSTGDYAVGEKATSGRKFDFVNEANVKSVLIGNTSKVIYVRIGDIEEDSQIQLRAFGVTYSMTGEDVPGEDDDYEDPPPPDKFYPDPYDDDEDYYLKDEFRVVVDSEAEFTDETTHVAAADLIQGEAGGLLIDGNRLLQGAEAVLYTFEIDPDAVFIKLDGWTANELEEFEGSQLFSVAIYDEGLEDYFALADCGTENGGALMPPRLAWNRFDNTWGRSDNNEYFVSDAPLNAAGDKKVVQIRLNGQFNFDLDGVLFYSSFVVKTVVPYASGDVDDTDDDPKDDDDPEDDAPQTSDNNLYVIFVLLALASAAIITMTIGVKTKKEES